jgi:hypothetical protein
MRLQLCGGGVHAGRMVLGRCQVHAPATLPCNERIPPSCLLQIGLLPSHRNAPLRKVMHVPPPSAPAIGLSTCATMYSSPFHQIMWPVHMSANVTAGLRCAPLMLENAYTATRRARL